MRLLFILFVLVSFSGFACKNCSSIMTQARKTTWAGPPNIRQTNGTFTTSSGRLSVRFVCYGQGQATGVQVHGVTADGLQFSQALGYGSHQIPPGTYTVYVQGHLYGEGTLEGHVCYD